MKKTITIIVALAVVGVLFYLNIAGVVFGATDCTKITIDNSFKTKTKQEKNDQLEQKIWQDVKRNEIPKWNPSIVTAEEMAGAYASLANKKDAKQKDNLWEGLRDKVGAEKCV